MNTQITTYYIPENPIILRGSIYTFYLNNNTNLDLSAVINTKNLQLQDLIQNNIKSTLEPKSTITISNEDYTRLLELNNQVYQLVEKRNIAIQDFIKKETTMTEEEKVLAIKKIQSLYPKKKQNDIIYFGDGLTDQKAFEYVHSIGGISVFVSNDISIYNFSLTKLQELNIIDKCFEADFSPQNDIYHYVKQFQKKILIDKRKQN